MPYRNYAYIVISEGAGLPISLAQVKNHLKLGVETSQDDYLTILIKAAAKDFERMTARVLITKVYDTYRDFFEDFLLKKGEIVTVDSIKYTDEDGNEATWDSANYGLAKGNGFRSVFKKYDGDFPEDVKEDDPDSITIRFTAGYGDTETAIPRDIHKALLIHIAALYAQRGDCEDQSTGNKYGIPPAALAIYKSYLIRDLVI